MPRKRKREAPKTPIAKSTSMSVATTDCVKTANGSCWAAALASGMEEVHPCITLGPAALETLVEILHDLHRRIMDVYHFTRKQGLVGVHVAVCTVIVGELWNLTRSEISKALAKGTHNQLYKVAYGQTLSSATNDAKVSTAMVAVLEYISKEILELAGNYARDDDTCVVTSRHINLAILNDEELSKLFSKNCCFANAGVLPNLRQVAPPPLRNGTNLSGHIDFGLELREAVEECSLQTAQQQVSEGCVVDTLTAWRLARRAGVMYAEIHAIAPELNVLVEGIVDAVWPAANSVSGMQRAIAAHPLLGFLAIAPVATDTVATTTNDEEDDDDDDGGGDDEDKRKSKIIVALAQLLDPIGPTAGRVKVGFVIQLKLDQDCEFEEIELESEDSESDDSESQDSEIEGNVSKPKAPPIAYTDEERLISALDGQSKEVLLTLMGRLGLTFEHDYNNLISNSEVVYSPQTIAQFIFLNRHRLSESIQSCLVAYATGWGPNDVRLGSSTLIPNFSSKNSMLCSVSSDESDNSIYFAAGGTATMQFPRPSGAASFAVSDVARARVHAMQRHNHGGILDPIRLRALVAAHAAANPGFKIDDRALRTLEVALTHRLVCLLEDALLVTTNRKRVKLCMKDVKIALDITTCKLRCSISNSVSTFWKSGDAGSEDARPEWGAPRPQSQRANPVDRNGMRIHMEPSKSEWLEVTETGLTTMMNDIVITPHASNAATSIMRGFTNYHPNPARMHRKWNCLAKVRPC